ncbi:MAG: ATP-dependent DNA helicase, partial [Clostridia bacterium]|nr:ATP-dependent DNA helicase [Clostridia bacterium]
MQKIHSVSVRALAEFAFEKGDLIPAARAAARMRDGTRGHQALQALLPVSWRSEAPVSRDIQVDGHVLRVHGRADALYVDREWVKVLEIKTTVKDPSAILKYDYPVHWAQGEIYAALFCLNEGAPRAEVRLTYARLDGKQRTFTEESEAWELVERLTAYARQYLTWIVTVDDWKERSRPTLERLPFPFETYRDGQREMALAVYTAMRDHANAVIEAPTGIGKTAAALFGALKALGRGHVSAIFYLTARTTGRRAAEDALQLMRQKGLAVRGVTITAKEKICPMDEGDCLGCPLAVGYYDRRRDALKEAMALQRLDGEAISDLAREHALCPFELSLDASETADVVICDYNYAFDPRVRLKRWFDGKSGAGLLVD